MLYYNHREGKKGGEKMDRIEKALKELQEAINNNDTVASVRVTITLTKPKPDRAKPKPKTK